MKNVVEYFGINDVLKIEPFGAGLINKTYLVTTTNNHYILQQLNTQVFNDVGAIESNMELLYKCDIASLFVPIIRTIDGRIFYKDDENQYWRISNYIENGIAYPMVEELFQAREAAKAFATFLGINASIQVDDIKIIIPDFHNSYTRWNQFENSIAGAKDERKYIAKNAILKAYEYKHIFENTQALVENMPLIITHNDTKINNVLIDPIANKFLNVIDLDTVMPGYLFYDFGDMIRTMTCSVDENEQDIEKVKFNRKVFEEICIGFSNGIKIQISEDEKKSLVHAGSYMALIMGIRFLTDFLNNDIYYRTTYDLHNLNRAKNQFQLVKKLESSKDYIQNIIRQYF